MASELLQSGGVRVSIKRKHRVTRVPRRRGKVRPFLGGIFFFFTILLNTGLLQALNVFVVLRNLLRYKQVHLQIITTSWRYFKETPFKPVEPLTVHEFNFKRRLCVSPLSAWMGPWGHLSRHRSRAVLGRGRLMSNHPTWRRGRGVGS